MSVGKIINTITNIPKSSAKLIKKISPNKKLQIKGSKTLEKTSECLSNIGKAQVKKRLPNPKEKLKNLDLKHEDIFLDEEANFYRIVSPDEVANLFKTKGTRGFIDADGHYTKGHYSCITTNPNYNEHAFCADGLPIRLKFKTKNEDGLYNASVLDRIEGLKQNRSIYKINGYNYDDVDWDNVYAKIGNKWVLLDDVYIKELAFRISNDSK